MYLGVLAAWLPGQVQATPWFEDARERQAAEALAAQWQVMEAAQLVKPGALPGPDWPQAEASRRYSELYLRLDAFWQLLAKQPWDELNLDDLGWQWQQLIPSGAQPLPADLYQAVLALEPEVPHYLALRNRIARLRYLAETPSPRVDPWGVIEPGDSHPELPAIRTQLARLGDWRADAQAAANGIEQALASMRYDPVLEAAVRGFQQRHGLAVDGIIGPNTRAWLSMPMNERARRLARTLIRRVHDQYHFTERYLLVNIPQYRLWWKESGNTRLTSRVVVGMPSRATPRMATELSSVVLNPHWNVPKSILRKDLLPKIRRDGHYVVNNHFQVLGRGNRALALSPAQLSDLASTRFPYSLRQRPGAHNALGRYKFHLVDENAIYLHDTPQKGLFYRPERALSSGCIRVEEAERLAQELLADRYSAGKLKRQLGAKTRWLKLSEPMPVYLVYWSAWMEGNQAQFRKDIYGVELPRAIGGDPAGQVATGPDVTTSALNQP